MPDSADAMYSKGMQGLSAAGSAPGLAQLESLMFVACSRAHVRLMQ